MLAFPKFCATEQYGLLEESLRRRGLLALLRRSLLETQLYLDVVSSFVVLFLSFHGEMDFLISFSLFYVYVFVFVFLPLLFLSWLIH